MASAATSIAAATRSWAASADSVMQETLGADLEVALLDFPYHDNFGDSAIWAGEQAWLERCGIRSVYTADEGRYQKEDVERMLPDGPVLLHGGGNFGDIWPDHQSHRERILADFPDRVIVQLPQTLGFTSDAEKQRIADAMSWHRGFVLLVRDERSLQLGQEMGLRTILAPDAAMNLEPIARKPARRPILVLARTDHEGSGLRQWAVENAGPDTVIEDWTLSSARHRVWTGLKVAPRVARRLTTGSRSRNALMRRMGGVYDTMANLMLTAAVEQLSSASVVITDRLHAHVIASLADIPNVVVDNNYGKVRGVFDAFSHLAPAATFADSPIEALEIARSLV